MSIEALNWALNLQLDKPSWKSVLIGIANHANPNGQAWPSVARLALYSGYKEKAIRAAIKQLIDQGLLSQELRAGTTPIYTLPIRGYTPVGGSPPPPVEGRHNLNRTINNKQRMQSDWRPTTKMIQFAHEFVGGSADDTARRIEDEAVRFRDYWIGTGKPMADWSATWRNWIRRSNTLSKPTVGTTRSNPTTVAAANNRLIDKLFGVGSQHQEPVAIEHDKGASDRSSREGDGQA